GFGALRAFLKGEESAESILQSFGFNPDEFQKVIQIMNSTKEALSRVWESFKVGKGYVEGFFAILRGDQGEGIDILKAIGLDGGQIQAVKDAVAGVKTTFSTFLSGIREMATERAGGIVDAFKAITAGAI